MIPILDKNHELFLFAQDPDLGTYTLKYGNASKIVVEDDTIIAHHNNTWIVDSPYTTNLEELSIAFWKQYKKGTLYETNKGFLYVENEDVTIIPVFSSYNYLQYADTTQTVSLLYDIVFHTDRKYLGNVSALKNQINWWALRERDRAEYAPAIRHAVWKDKHIRNLTLQYNALTPIQKIVEIPATENGQKITLTLSTVPQCNHVEIYARTKYGFWRFPKLPIRLSENCVIYKYAKEIFVRVGNTRVRLDALATHPAIVLALQDL